jgi:hypothetical protein
MFVNLDQNIAYGKFTAFVRGTVFIESALRYLSGQHCAICLAVLDRVSIAAVSICLCMHLSVGLSVRAIKERWSDAIESDIEGTNSCT